MFVRKMYISRLVFESCTFPCFCLHICINIFEYNEMIIVTPSPVDIQLYCSEIAG